MERLLLGKEKNVNFLLMKNRLLFLPLMFSLFACQQQRLIEQEAINPQSFFRTEQGLFSIADYDSVYATSLDGFISINNARTFFSGYTDDDWQSREPLTEATSKMLFSPSVLTWGHGSVVQPVGTPSGSVARDVAHFPAMASYKQGAYIPITYGEITRTLYLPPALRLLSYPFTVVPSEDPDQEEVFVDRNNFTLTWNADTANHSGVIIHIDCVYPGMNNSKNYQRYEVVPDNGSYTVPAAAFGTIENGATFRIKISRGDYAIIYPMVNNQRKRIVITTESLIESQDLTMRN